MGKGMRSYGRKQRREMRRRNHVAKDLHSPKYRQRKKEGKRKSEFNFREIEEFDNG